MRVLSPLELALAGTIAVHLIVITVADAIVLTHPPEPREVAPHIEMVDIEAPPVLAPPPPPVAAEPPPPTIASIATPTPIVHAPTHTMHTAPAPTTPTPEIAPTPTLTPTPNAGGDTVYHMDNIAPSANGVAVAPGRTTTGHLGRGGSGGGTGEGSGSGAAIGEIPAPMSIATIKTRALPKAGFDYLDLGKDYPAEAKQLGIEGKLHVRLVVDPRGKVAQSRLLDHLGHGLDEPALQRAAAIEFTPALDADDHPVTSVVVWTFTMHLPP